LATTAWILARRADLDLSPTMDVAPAVAGGRIRRAASPAAWIWARCPGSGWGTVD